MRHLLTLIVVLPLAGFVINGVLGTRLGGGILGKRAVTAIGCGMPIASFALAIVAMLQLQASGTPLVETAEDA